jgi:phage tail-like protein
MRGTLPEAPTPQALGSSLPGVYLDDDLTQRLCAALDTVLAPVHGTLDSLTAYFDPATTPADMLDWLASWVGLAADQGRSVEKQRRLVAAAAELHSWRGTVRGLRESLRVLVPGRIEIEEGGGAAWSVTPGAPLPGTGSGRVVVQVGMEGATAEDQARIDALVAAVKPAHVPHATRIVPDQP